ncbi:MAG: hypothetical protein IPG09_18240 [Ignavibacteria bacterium]|nr:hypothetical protein [Ignavibacteria bacterium]
MTLKGSSICNFTPGDINQDGIIDVAGDLSQVENDAQIFTFGYSATDVNGDRSFVDAADLAIVKIIRFWEFLRFINR